MDFAVTAFGENKHNLDLFVNQNIQTRATYLFSWRNVHPLVSDNSRFIFRGEGALPRGPEEGGIRKTYD